MTDEKISVSAHERNKPLKSKPPQTRDEKIPHSQFSDPQQRVAKGVKILSKSEKNDGTNIESKSRGGTLETTVTLGRGDTEPLDADGRRQHS
jgi:hypothetical protein